MVPIVLMAAFVGALDVGEAPAPTSVPIYQRAQHQHLPQQYRPHKHLPQPHRFDADLDMDGGDFKDGVTPATSTLNDILRGECRAYADFLDPHHVGLTAKFSEDAALDQADRV